MTKDLNKNLIIFVSVLTLSFVGLMGKNNVYASCTQNYGGGQTCVYNKNFDIEKKVRKEGDDSWKDKVTNVKKGEIVEFRVKIKNDGDIDVDDMKMEDKLPREMERVGGSGLTEYWDDFEKGESKTFIIKARVKDSEYERENFEKCVVNKAVVEYKGDEEASDTATVCYGSVKPSELPRTGNGMFTLALGSAFVALGVLLRKKVSTK